MADAVRSAQPEPSAPDRHATPQGRQCASDARRHNGRHRHPPLTPLSLPAHAPLPQQPTPHPALHPTQQPAQRLPPLAPPGPAPRLSGRARAGWPHDPSLARWRPGLRVLGVLAAHAVLLALLSPLLLPRVPTRAAGPGPAPLWLRWVRPDPVADARQRERPSAAAARSPAAPPRPHDRPARAKPPEPISVAPAADRPLAPTAAAPAAARTAGPEPAAAPVTEGPHDASHARTPPAPLNLALPSAPQRAASQPPAAWARQDPRVNTTRPREDRMAQTLGTDLQLRETALNDGARRWQRGTGCLQTRPSRDSQINAQSEVARRQPQLGEPC